MTAAAVRRALLAQREQDLCRLHGITLPAAAVHGDQGDLSVATDAREMAAGERDRLRARVLLIDAALARVQDGTYGLCVDCFDPVAPKRLATHPEVARCLGCQEKAERRATTGGRGVVWAEEA